MSNLQERPQNGFTNFDFNQYNLDSKTFDTLEFWTCDLSNQTFLNTNFYNCLFVNCTFNTVHFNQASLKTCFFINCEFDSEKYDLLIFNNNSDIITQKNVDTPFYKKQRSGFMDNIFYDRAPTIVDYTYYNPAYDNIVPVNLATEVSLRNKIFDRAEAVTIDDDSVTVFEWPKTFIVDKLCFMTLKITYSVRAGFNLLLEQFNKNRPFEAKKVTNKSPNIINNSLTEIIVTGHTYYLRLLVGDTIC